MGYFSDLIIFIKYTEMDLTIPENCVEFARVVRNEVDRMIRKADVDRGIFLEEYAKAMRSGLL